MKAKFLLPTLVGLTLAACTAEEDFSQSAEIKQSPITFTVDKDGAELDARATLSGSVVNFSTGDLISLYHSSTLPNTYPGKLGAGQNAIFEGEGLDGALVFKTKSMVLAGNAVMVYPADTSFVNTVGGDITISVPAEQDAETKLFQPYMSEAFNIGAYDGMTGKNDNTAGYGRNYTVPLKKVGSLLTMNLIPQNVNVINDIEGVDDVVLESVEINASSAIFATKVAVNAKDEKPVLAQKDKVANSDVEKFAHLKKVTEVWTSETTNKISTEDIADNKAYFTLLPNVAEPTSEESTAAAAAPTTITVNTSYGKVVVTSATTVDQTKPETYPLVKSGESVHVTLDAAINNIVNSAWGENTSSSNFKGENTGASFTRTFTFDLKDVDMDGTKVKTSKQLIDLLKVYKALGIESAVVWYLDGENNEFLMTGDALDKLIEVNANKTITLHKNSNKIVLSDADATIAKLQNEKVIFNNPQGGADVVLGANLNWTIDQKLTNVNIAKLTNRGTLNVTNTTSATDALIVNLINEGEMTIGSTKVTLGKFTTEEDSELKVATGQTLYFGGKTYLYGKLTNEGIVSANNGDVTNLGTIDNKFELSVVENSDGKFNNGGYIHNNGSSAVTYLTSNQGGVRESSMEGMTLTFVPYTGVIELTNRDDQVSIDGEKGYIKYTLKDNEKDYEPAKGDKFNWLTIDKTATVKLNGQNASNSSIKETVDYLEITGDPTNIECNGFVVIDLFVEGSMRLLAGNTMTATNVYVKNYILRAAGALTGTQITSYMPETCPKPEKAIEYSGEIRTAK